jgi:hypothetical protein
LPTTGTDVGVEARGTLRSDETRGIRSAEGVATDSGAGGGLWHGTLGPGGEDGAGAD